MREVCQLAEREGLFSALIFGWCPTHNALRVFELCPRYGDGPLRIEIQERHLDPISIGGAASRSVVIIGSDPSLLASAIYQQLADAKGRGEVHDIVAFDAPKRALRRLIQEGAHEFIGGAVQQAWATVRGFQIVSNMEPITPRPPAPRNAGLFILGFDTFDIQMVGNYQVSSEGR
jgi:hypothetical protein